MQTLLAELNVVQPTYLVCREQDRLHRSSLEWELLQHQMVKAGVEAVVQWPNLQGTPIVTRLSESKDRAFASIQAAFASLQKADTKAKLMAGRRERAAQGLPNGGFAPYPYERVKRATRADRAAPFVINDAEAETYCQMIQWTLGSRRSVPPSNVPLGERRSPVLEGRYERLPRERALLGNPERHQGSRRLAPVASFAPIAGEDADSDDQHEEQVEEKQGEQGLEQHGHLAPEPLVAQRRRPAGLPGKRTRSWTPRPMP